MTRRYAGLFKVLVAVLLTGCAREPSPIESHIDSQLAAQIASIRAIDNHAHPVLSSPGDRDFDALPVDNMEPASDPLIFRPGNPAVKAATQALYGASSKPAAIREKGDRYPAWVLDKLGVDIMLANRVAMGASIQPPRFRWVPYIDFLLFPLDNTQLAARNSDRKAFFALEDQLRARYLQNQPLPATLVEYLSTVVTPILERHKQGGAVAEKFEVAYLRSLSFDDVPQSLAEQVYRQRARDDADYKQLQDFLFRYIARECGRLGMAVHIHTMAGAGGYFDVAGANPLNLEPLFNDPTLRQTKFVMVHGGWPFTKEIGALLTKPNAYLDISGQTLLLPPDTVAASLREWLTVVPEKVMFATDAYPYSTELGWEESGWLAARNGREALGRALTAMLHDGAVTRERAIELARMVLRENAKALYGL